MNYVMCLPAKGEIANNKEMKFTEDEILKQLGFS